MSNVQRIELSLEIDDSLSPIIDSNSFLNKEICMEITKGLNKILEILGIPGKSKVFIANLEKKKALTNRFMRIILNGHQCRYPDEILILVQNYIQRKKSDISYELGRDLKSVFLWLKTLLDGQAELNNVNHQCIIEFFSLSCMEIVKTQPEILLNSVQFNAYLSLIPLTRDNENLNSERWSPYHNRMYQILRKVISQRISIANKQKIIDIIYDGWLKYSSDEDIIEELLVTLRTDVIKIQMPKDYLEEMTKAQQYNESRDMFKMARDGLFYELGVHYPDFQFIINENLSPRSFSFRINHLTTLTQKGLKPYEFLVNDTTERLKLLNINGKPTNNPVNLSECSIIHLKDKSLAERAGLTTWDYIGYLILSLSAILRKYSSYFIHVDRIEDDLDEYSYSSSAFAGTFPELANAVKSVVSVESITRLLRKLVCEEISIRNLHDIFEAVLKYYQNSDFNQFNNLVKIDYLTDFVRSSLKRYISHKYSSRKNTLVIYLLEPKIEANLLDFERKSPLDHPPYKKMLNSIRDELNENLTISQNLIILTKFELRSFLREIIAPECPRIAVLSYSEINADFDIQPMDMIKLTT